jgi:hypothetical protein
MRIYLLVTNYNPLTMYIYRTGFARFTHTRYSNDNVFNLSYIKIKRYNFSRGTFNKCLLVKTYRGIWCKYWREIWFEEIEIIDLIKVIVYEECIN